jgi:hypothetical protein
MFGWFKKKKKKEEVVQEPKVEVVEKEEVVEQEEPEVIEEEVKEETEEEIVEEEQVEKVEAKEEPKKRKMINHITKHKDGGWQIKKGGAQRALKRFSTQKEAIEFAKGLEETTGTSYIIHKADGTTRKKKY